MIEMKAKLVAVVVPVVFVAGIGLSMALDLWQTSTTKEPASYTSGEFAGQANPADIRGSYTFGDVTAAFPGVPLAALADAFGVKEDAAAFAVKNLEAMELGTEALEIGTDSVRLFVSRYLGLPFAPVEGTGLPARAVELLAATGRLEETVLADLRARAVDTGAVAETAQAAAAPAAAPEPAPASKVASSVTAPAAAAATPAATEAAPAGGASAGTSATADHAAADAAAETRSVKGSTTFGDLATWGVTAEALEEVLGEPPGAAGTTVRNWCVDRGIEFSTVRAAVQALVDAAAP